MPNSYVEPATPPAPVEQLSFLSVLNFVLRNIVLMVVAGIIVSALLVARAFSGEQTYSSTSIFSAGEETAAGLLSNLSLPGISSGKGPAYYTALMTSPAVLEPLVDMTFTVPGGSKKTLTEYYGGTSGPIEARRDAAASAVKGKISYKIGTTGWITLTTTAETPELALELNQAVLAQIDSFNTKTRRDQSIADRKFAEDRLAEVSVERQSAERRMADFLERNRDCCSPPLEFERQRLSAEVASKQNSYNSMVAAVEREKLNAARELRVITVIGRPRLASGPDGRAWRRAAAMGLFIGAFLGAVIAFVLEYFRWIREHPSPQYEEFLKLRRRLLGPLARILERRSRSAA